MNTTRRARILHTALGGALLLGASAIGVGTASANNSNWGSNGSATCSAVETPAETIVGPLSAANGQYCTQSVSGWIGIGFDDTGAYMQSCNAAGSAWSLDGQSIVNNGPWWYTPVPSWTGRTGNNVGWNGSSNGFSSEAYFNQDGTDQAGAWPQGQATPDWGQTGASVTFWGNGTNFNGSSWQVAVGCLNNAGAQCWINPIPPACGGLPPNNIAAVTGLFTESERRRGEHAGASPTPDRVGTMRTATATKFKRPAETRGLVAYSRTKSRALRVDNLNVQAGRTRTASLTCPAGYVRSGRLNSEYVMWTPTGKAPAWKDHTRLTVRKSRVGTNGGRATITVSDAKYPTQVQLQLQCTRA